MVYSWVKFNLQELQPNSIRIKFPFEGQSSIWLIENLQILLILISALSCVKLRFMINFFSIPVCVPHIPLY
jgi:hypothetical protein